jgi:hypothetical protein
MKNLILLLLCVSLICKSQSRLVLSNGAFVVIDNDAALVIDNPNANAITETGSGGHIISESENNRVKWNITTSTGTYTLPFTTGGFVKIPFRISITGAAVGGPSDAGLIFSTYATASNNTPLPTGVVTFGDQGGLNAIDRFWLIDDNGYASRPSGVITFTYIDSEYDPPNTLLEGNLGAQRYNPAINDWNDMLPVVSSLDPVGNVLTTSSIPAADFLTHWTLSDISQPLPVELLSFQAQPDHFNRSVILSWSTASEHHSDVFIIQRSTDAERWEIVSQVKAAGVSVSKLNYQFTDVNPYPETSYYRLKQVDTDGRYQLSPLVAVTLDNAGLSFNLYPIPASDQIYLQTFSEKDVSILIYNKLGVQLHPTVTKHGFHHLIDLRDLAAGLYLLKVTDHITVASGRFIIER